MSDLDKTPTLKAEESDSQPTESTKPKETVVIPTAPKPIEVAPTPKGKEVTAMTDPEGVFDYSGCQVHVVQAGETLYSIAQKYVVAMQQLRYFNHLSIDNPKIRVGQKLAIPNKPIQVPYAK